MAAEVTASTEVMLPVSVQEAWAVLSDTRSGGCRYRVTITVTPTLPLLGPLFARVLIRTMVEQEYGDG